MTALIVAAHGSRDPRSAHTVAAAVDRIRAARPDLDVRLGFLDLNAPSIDQVMDSVAAEGYLSAVVVPLLLGSAFHARVDLPALLAAARARHPQLSLVQAPVLGDDQRLIDAVRERVFAAGGSADDPGLGIALAAVGSSDPAANIRTRRVAAHLADGTAWAGAVTCFATAVEPTVSHAITQLRASGAERVIVASWFLAPGRLTDRVRSAADAVAPGVVHADVIGAHPLLAEVALDRFDAGAALIGRSVDLALSA